MRNLTIGLLAALAVVPTGLFAFSASDNIKDSATLGSCTVYLEVNAANGKAYVGVSANIAGGSYWNNSEITPGRLSMSVAQLSNCLSTPTSNITGFAEDGANGTFAGDDYVGFKFTLTTAAGGLSAGPHEYKVGSGSFPVATNAGGGNAPANETIGNTSRQLYSQISINQKLVREGRTRFIQSRRQMRGDGAGISSRNSVDFEFDGTLNVTNGRISSQGAFFQQDGNFEGTSRRVVFGDFDIQRSDDTGSTTATLTGKMAWERMLDEQNMIGYYVGADVARSNIKGTYTGEQDTYGISVGTYFVSALQENLFLDGFVSLGVGKNDLTLADGTVDLNGDFTSRSVTLGTALTGVIKQEGYEIWPELAFTYGKTRLGTIGMTDRLAAVANNSVTVDAGDVSIANLTLRPEFRMPMDGLASVDSLSLFTFAPRLLCEQVDTTAKTKNCGGGAEFGIDRTSEDGRSRFVARIKADRIAKVTRSALELKLEHRF